MNKIIELSENGFKLDECYDNKNLGYTNKWFTCDNFKVIKKGLFKELKVGSVLKDIVSVKGKNNKDYVVSFTVLHHKDQGEEENISKNFTSLKSTPNTLNSLKSNSLPVSNSVMGDVVDSEREEAPLNSLKPSSVQDSIRYAQCVNLSFASVNLGGFITEEAGIVYAFNRADKIFKEFNKRLK